MMPDTALAGAVVGGSAGAAIAGLAMLLIASRNVALSERFATACLGLGLGITSGFGIEWLLSKEDWATAIESGLVGAVTTVLLAAVGIFATVWFVRFQLGEEERRAERQQAAFKLATLRLLRHEAGHAALIMSAFTARPAAEFAKLSASDQRGSAEHEKKLDLFCHSAELVSSLCPWRPLTAEEIAAIPDAVAGSHSIVGATFSAAMSHLAKSPNKPARATAMGAFAAGLRYLADHAELTLKALGEAPTTSEAEVVQRCRQIATDVPLEARDLLKESTAPASKKRRFLPHSSTL